MENELLSERIIGRISIRQKQIIEKLQIENDCTASMIIQLLCEKLATNNLEITPEEIKAQKSAHKAWSYKKKKIAA